MIGSPARAGKHRPRKPNGPNRASTRPVGPKKEKRGFFRRWWWMFLLVPLVALIGLIGTIAYVYANTDVPEAPVGAQTTIVYDRHGRVIARLHAGENRIVLDFEDISENLKNAVIASEDKAFYSHGGVSYISIVRAAWANVTHGQIEQGGSTITQQYVKNVYTGAERTVGRKIREAILAVKIDHDFTKDEILAKYLNTVYFGNGAYGAQAAAQTYFGIPAKRLDVLQAATLAGVIPAPGAYDPIRHPDEALKRRNLVLDLMAQQGHLSSQEAGSLKQESLEVKEAETQNQPYAYFVSHVSKLLQDDYGYAETFRGGLRVRTGLDIGMQRAAEAAVADSLPDPKGPIAAVVAIDPGTGEIRALVGGKDFNRAKFNVATQGHRQTGSAFKPFTFLAAMQQRIDPKSLWRGPSELTLDDPRCLTKGEPWEVHNYADESTGTMSLLDATAHSVNTIFAQVVVTVGPDAVVDTASEAGIQTPLNPVCSITLGTQEVTPLDMATAYATLAARGMRHWPLSIVRVRTADGDVLDERSSDPQQVLEQNDADLTTYALQGVVERGTGVAAALPDGRPVAGKTGTTQNFGDAWFCGYVPQLAACVWVGYKDDNIPMHGINGVENVTGGSIPASIWHDFMTVATKKLEPASFATPSFEGYTVEPTGSVPSPSPVPSTAPPTPPPSPTPSPTPSEPPPPSPSPPPPSSPPPSQSPSPSGSIEPSPSGNPPSRPP